MSTGSLTATRLLMISGPAKALCVSLCEFLATLRTATATTKRVLTLLLLMTRRPNLRAGRDRKFVSEVQGCQLVERSASLKLYADFFLALRLCDFQSVVLLIQSQTMGLKMIVLITLEQIVISVITSGITAAIIAFIGKAVIARYIDHSFKKREELNSSQLKLRVSAGEALFDKELSIYPEVAEVVYRCRNLARECLDQHSRNRSSILEFTKYTVHLSENLYKYRLFFPEETFRLIHRFKNEIQGYMILLNEVSRPQNVEDAPVDFSIQELAESQMTEKYNLIDELYQKVVPKIHEVIFGKTNID